MNEKELDELIPKNINSLKRTISELNILLNCITPEKGNFLFTDLIGRIVYNTCATSNSIMILAKEFNDYGVKSLTRKIYESYIILYFLLNSKNKSKEIAKILASEYSKENNLDLDNLISKIEKIVLSFNEDNRIIEEFKIQIKLKKKYWHWSGKSLNNILKEIHNDTNIIEFDRDLNNLKLEMLYDFNKYVHIDFELEQDFLTTNENGINHYKNPFEYSKVNLYKYLGFNRLILKDIIKILTDNKKSFANTS